MLLLKPLFDHVLDAATNHIVGVGTERLVGFTFVIRMAARDIVIHILGLGDDVGTVFEVNLQTRGPSHLLLLLLLLFLQRSLDPSEERLRLWTGSASNFGQVYLRDLEGVGRTSIGSLISRRLREAEWSICSMERYCRLRRQSCFRGG